jgi:hypothetical protein
MNATLASVVAIPLLALSSVSFAEEIVAPAPAEPMMLSVAQMDGVTAGDPFEITVNSSGLLQVGNIQGTGGYNFIYYPVVVYAAPVTLQGK